MSKKKRYFLTSAVLAGIFLAGSLTYHPSSQAKGAYSTPVTVMNTNSNSVPVLDTERQARIPYESSVAASNCTATTCFFFFSGPPAGYRLVAENVAGYFQTSSSVTIPPVGYIEDSGFRIRLGFTAPLGPIDAGGHIQAGFNQPTRFYLDPSQGAPFAVVSSAWTNGSSTMVLTGYLENCSITGCPAVQH